MSKPAISKSTKQQMKQRTQVALVDRSIMSLLPKRRQGVMTRKASAPTLGTPNI